MKKFLCVFCSFCMFFTFNASALETALIPDIEEPTISDINANGGTVILNEYDFIQKIKTAKQQGKLTAKQIKNEFSLSDEAVQQLDNSDAIFKKNLEDKRALSDESLLNSGYTKEQIKIIKDATADPEIAYQASSAQLYASLSKTSFTYSSPQTKLVARIEWSWTSQPLFVGNDIWAFSCSEGMYLTTATQYSVAKIWYYRNGDTGNMKEEVAKSVTPTGPVCGGSVKFAMNNPDYSTNEPRIALAGVMQITWTKQSSLAEVSVYAKYGHSTIVVSPSVSISADGASISFRPQLTVQESAYVYKHWIR